MAFDFPNAPTLNQTYQGYVWDGEKWISTTSPSPPNQSGVIGIQVFTASGQYMPSANMTTCVIECVGGGGAGGGATAATSFYTSGGGGGGGAYARKMATAAQIGISQTVTIGAGGTGATNSAGNSGASSSVGALCVAAFGAGGALGTSGTRGLGSAGGSAGSSTGDFTLTGGAGIDGFYMSAVPTAIAPGGGGGSTYYGTGAVSRSVSGGQLVNGFNGSLYGSGGGGGCSANQAASHAAGGAGANGLVVITEYGMTALSSASAQQGSVRFDLPQGLTANQTAQARANIWVTKKNYVINGGMQISQENGTTAGTVSGYFPVDQFQIGFSNAGTQTAQQVASVTPGGSPNRMRVTATVADASVAASDTLSIFHELEGLRVADLRFGSAAAKTVTIQFGCKGPAGTYTVTLRNAGANRAYPAEYTIAAGEANTDVIKSVTIPGDTTGTWAADSTKGITVIFCLMAGSTYAQAPNAWISAGPVGSTNQFNFMSAINNVFELFDVSLTEGTVAPPFQVPDYPTELALCQRYWQKLNNVVWSGYGAATNPFYSTSTWSPSMRGTPAAAMLSPAYSNANAATIQSANSTTVTVQASITATGNGFVNAASITGNARL